MQFDPTRKLFRHPRGFILSPFAVLSVVAAFLIQRAIKYASATGAFSTRTWLDAPAGSTTTAPGATDIADANGKTVAMDVNATVGTLTNANVASGQFTCSNSGLITTAVIANGTNSTTTFLWSGTNITGTVTGGFVAGAGTALNAAGTGTITITGNSTGGTANTAFGIFISGNIIVNGSGNLTAGTAAGSSDSVSSSSAGLRINNGTLTWTGHALGNASAGGIGLAIDGAPVVTFNGNSTGGSVANAYGILSVGTGRTTINGTVTGGTAAVAYGLRNTAAGTIALSAAQGNGFGIGSSGVVGCAGLSSTNQSAVITLQQSIAGSRGWQAYEGAVIMADSTNNTATFCTVATNSTMKTLTDPNASAVFPSAANVRSGTTYNSGNLTGTLAVPAAGSVALGVAVDNTTGTAVLTQTNCENAVWEGFRSQHTNTGTFGISLGKADANELQKVDVEDWRANAVPVSDTPGYPIITIKNGSGSGELTTSGGSLATVSTVLNGVQVAGFIGGRSATPQAVSASSITLDGAASAIDNHYTGWWIVIISGVGVGQAPRLITGYVGSTKVATIAPNWSVNPTTGSGFAMVASGAVSVARAANLDNLDAKSSDIKPQTDKIGTTGGDSTYITDIRTQTNLLEFTGQGIKSDVMAVEGITGRAADLATMTGAYGAGTFAIASAASVSAVNTTTSVTQAVDVSVGSQTSIAAAVWAYATTSITTAGSIGKRILDLISGMTSLPKWLQTLFRKSTPDATAVSEINSGGGTYGTASSLEGLNTLISAGGSVTISAQQVRDAMTLDASSILTLGNASIDAYLIGLRAGRIIPRSPVVDNGQQLILIRSTDYSVIAGQPLEWTDTASIWPTISGAAISLSLRIKNADGSAGDVALHKAGAVLVGSGSGKQIRVELTAADTADMVVGWRNHFFDVMATLTSGEKVTLVRGEASLQENYQP